MSVTSYGHTPNIPRGMYPTLAAQMNSNGSYRGDVTMVSAASSNTMNGITSPVSSVKKLVHIFKILFFTEL